MAAVRRSSGKGTVIAMVVFIVLAFAGIGVSIWLYQQRAIVEQAARANQEHFRREVGAFFQDQGWDLDRRIEPSYGLEYGEQAYVQLRRKLEDAAMLQQMRPALGWDQAETLQEAVGTSPVQQEADVQYETLRGLFGHYEEEYQRLTGRVAELNRELETTQNQLADQSEAMREMQDGLEREKNRAIEEHRESIARLREQHNEMQEMYRNTREELEDWRDQFDEARREWEERFEALEEDVAGWRQAYQDAVRPPEEIERLQPAGEVLNVEPRHQFVVLSGGRDEGRERTQNFVIYTVTPADEPQEKGRVIATNVHETTTLAGIEQQITQMVEGDLFVTEATWKRFVEDEEPVVRRPEVEVPEEPPVERVPEEVEPPIEEEAPPEEEDDFIFEF